MRAAVATRKKIVDKVAAVNLDNGCDQTYRAYAVLMKRDIEGGLYIMRTLMIKNGAIVGQEDTIADLSGVQMGKAIIGLEEVLK